MSVCFDNRPSGLSHRVYLTRTPNCPLIGSGRWSPPLSFQNNVAKHVSNEAQSLISSHRLHSRSELAWKLLALCFLILASTSLTTGLIFLSRPPLRCKEKEKNKKQKTTTII